ncbi:MAG: DEAD/DEAH box helicase, partial [Anaerolineae bacterium]
MEQLEHDPQIKQRITHWRHMPARPGRYASFPSELDPRLIAALEQRGIRQLYTHQALAVGAALRGENVVLVTPTASGKTLGYNLPVLHALLNDQGARALYLFPTKALAQDQLAELAELQSALPGQASPGRQA